MSAPVTAQAVRSALRAEGVKTSHDRSRQAVRVPDARYGPVVVSVDYDSPSEARRTAAAIAELLTARGFAVELDETWVSVVGRREQS